MNFLKLYLKLSKDLVTKINKLIQTYHFQRKVDSHDRIATHFIWFILEIEDPSLSVGNHHQSSENFR